MQIDDEDGDGEGGWGDDDSDLDLGDIGGDDDAANDDAGEADAGYYVPPTKGVPVRQHWTQNSTLPADHVAAGAFENAMTLLNKQIGIVDFAPMKPFFMQVFSQGAVSVTGMVNVNGIPYVPRDLPSQTVCGATLFRSPQDRSASSRGSLLVAQVRGEPKLGRCWLGRKAVAGRAPSGCDPASSSRSPAAGSVSRAHETSCSLLFFFDCTDHCG